MNNRSVFKTSIILSAISSFVFFIYEPIAMYATNYEEIWFDLYFLLKISAILFIISFAIKLGIFFIFYKIGEKYSKTTPLRAAFCAYFFYFIISYIHANLLSFYLPTIGDVFVRWGDIASNLSSLIMSASCLALMLLIIKRFKKKAIKIFRNATIVIFLMISTSLIACLSKPAVFEQKNDLSLVSTRDGINTLSTTKNYFILLVDAVDSKVFYEELNNNNKAMMDLRDFTYYPDTLSGYPFTRWSVPFIFSSNWYSPGQTYEEYSTQSFNNSPILNKIENDNDYKKYFFDDDFVWNDERLSAFENIAHRKDARTSVYALQLSRYVFFKTLPWQLKRLTNPETISFNDGSFQWENELFLQDPIKRRPNFVDEKVFSYIHLEGAHTPFTVYEDKVAHTIKTIDSFIEYLKSNNAYDNSIIVILADHGLDDPIENAGRQNPILLIKGTDEHNTNLQISNKQISQEDLADTFIQLEHGAKNRDIFKGIPTNNRKRKHILVDANDIGMTELETTDKADNFSALKPTD